MLTVSDLSKQANVTPDTVRHYIQIGLLNPVRRMDNGYRLFDTEALNRLSFIVRAKQLGFTLNDIKVIFEHKEKGESPCLAVRELIKKRVDENREKLANLNELQTRMDKAVETWAEMPDSDTDDAICELIDSVTL